MHMSQPTGLSTILSKPHRSSPVSTGNVCRSHRSYEQNIMLQAMHIYRSCYNLCVYPNPLVYTHEAWSWVRRTDPDLSQLETCTNHRSWEHISCYNLCIFIDHATIYAYVPTHWSTQTKYGLEYAAQILICLNWKRVQITQIAGAHIMLQSMHISQPNGMYTRIWSSVSMGNVYRSHRS